MKTIACISGKGGVGKTTVTIGTAYALAEQGYRVGIIDLDLESSSLGDALGLTHEKLSFREKIEPTHVNGIKSISLSLFMEEGWEDVPTLLPEERINSLVHQLFTAVNWGELDFMLVDHPPGSGAEVRSLVKHPVDGFILIASNQRLSEMPVRRLIRMARQEYNVPILGIVSNNPYNITGDTTTAKLLSERYQLPILAEIPWSPEIATAMDNRSKFSYTPFTPIADFLTVTFYPERNVALSVRRMSEGQKTVRNIAEALAIPQAKVRSILKEHKNERGVQLPEAGHRPGKQVRRPKRPIQGLAKGEKRGAEGVPTTP